MANPVNCSRLCWGGSNGTQLRHRRGKQGDKVGATDSGIDDKVQKAAGMVFCNLCMKPLGRCPENNNLCRKAYQ